MLFKLKTFEVGKNLSKAPFESMNSVHNDLKVIFQFTFLLTVLRLVYNQENLFSVKKRQVEFCINSAYEPSGSSGGAYPGFSSMKRLGVHLLPLDGLLVQGYPQRYIRRYSFNYAPRWGGVLCQHNSMTRTLSARSGVGRAKHDATAPPTK